MNYYNNMNNYSNYNNYNNYNYYQNNYYYQLQEVQRREKRALRTNASKMGALLLIYYLLSNMFVNVYYYMVYAYCNHEVNLNYNEVIVYLRNNKELINSSIFSMAGNLFVVSISLLVTMIIAIAAMNVDLSEMMTPRKGDVKQAATWFPVCMTINIIVSMLVAYLSMFMSEAGLTVPEADISVKQNDPLTAAIYIAYVIIVGPMAEEIIYRGIILTLLKPFGKWMAVFFSALMFGLMHGNIPQAAAAFAGALIYGIVAVNSNSIVPTIMIHMANNIVASYMDFCEVFGWYKWFYYVFIVLIIPIAIYMIATKYNQLKVKNDYSYYTTSGQRYRTVFANVFVIIYLLILLVTFVTSFIMAN